MSSIHGQDVCHLTSVHNRRDTRIWVKETATIRAAGYPVRLCVMDGKGDEESSGVLVTDVGSAPHSRLARSLLGCWRMWREAVRRRPRLIHFHDPELIPMGCLARLAGIKVVYDVHEDNPRQVMERHWLPPWLRWFMASLMSASEWVAGQVFDGIVAATPTIGLRFPKRKTVVVQNFPSLAEIGSQEPLSEPDACGPDFLYVGIIGVARGAVTMVRALEHIPSSLRSRLLLAGISGEPDLLPRLEALPGWKRVDYVGWADRAQVVALLRRVRAGLVTLHPVQNYLDGYPVKMFEYMAAGLPVIASDFPLWRSIVEQAGCGLLVDPQKPAAIAAAMTWVIEHPAEAAAMGRRGRVAVIERYNWEFEAEKLLAFYARLLHMQPSQIG